MLGAVSPVRAEADGSRSRAPGDLRFQREWRRQNRKGTRTAAALGVGWLAGAGIAAGLLVTDGLSTVLAFLVTIATVIGTLLLVGARRMARAGAEFAAPDRPTERA